MYSGWKSRQTKTENQHLWKAWGTSFGRNIYSRWLKHCPKEGFLSLVGACDMRETSHTISVIANGRRKVELATHCLQYMFHGFTGFRRPVAYYGLSPTTAHQIYLTVKSFVQFINTVPHGKINSSCTTTVLSKLLTSCLTAVKKHWIRYYDTVYERDGIKYFWSIKNSNDVLNKFKSINFQASKLSTYDFSTLYITLPHHLIKDKLIDIINRTFIRQNTLYLACNEECAFFTSDVYNNHNLWVASGPRVKLASCKSA